MRYCNRSWFDTFPFTALSPSKQRIFCLPCILFPVLQATSGQASVLITSPLVNWKDAVRDLTAHCAREYHLSSETRMEAFLRTMENSSNQIDTSISQQAMDTVKQNRAKLISIIKCLGRNGIALRGHRDDGTCLDGSDTIATQGNFKAFSCRCW